MILSENTAELFEALAKFHANAPTIKKDRTVNVRKNGEFLYSFDYATLGNIINTTKPVLAEHGLSVTQNVGSEGVRTMVAHESGQYLITDALQVDLEGDEQDQGSSITYKKRYQMSGALNLDSEFDDDGNVASGNEPEFEDDRQAPIKGKGGSSTKSKKTDAPKPEPETEQEEEETQQDEPPFDPDEDDVMTHVKSFDDSTELISWWKDFLDEGDEAEKMEKYRDDVFEYLQEIQ